MFTATLISYPDRDAPMDSILEPHPEGGGEGAAGPGSGGRVRRPGTPLSLTPVEVTVDDEQDGSYVGRFTATIAGSYELQVSEAGCN